MRRLKAMSLREWRESAGLTQRELARLARVARASISHIENGYYPPTPGFAGKVCRALSAQLDCKLHTWELFPGVFRAPLLPAPPPQPEDDAETYAAAQSLLKALVPELAAAAEPARDPALAPLSVAAPGKLISFPF